jgi:hypothetical protein
VEKTISQRKNKIWKGARKMKYNEPWIIDIKENGKFADVLDSKCEVFVDDLDVDWARRIVSCVNALAGIDNPAEYIEGLKAKNKRLVEALEKIQMHEVELLQRGVWFDSEVDRIIVLALTENEKGVGQ